MQFTASVGGFMGISGPSSVRKLKLPLKSDRKIVLPDFSLVTPMTLRLSESPRSLKIPSFLLIFPPMTFLISKDLGSSSFPESGEARGSRLSASIASRLRGGDSESVADEFDELFIGLTLVEMSVGLEVLEISISSWPDDEFNVEISFGLIFGLILVELSVRLEILENSIFPSWPDVEFNVDISFELFVGLVLRVLSVSFELLEVPNVDSTSEDIDFFDQITGESIVSNGYEVEERFLG